MNCCGVCGGKLVSESADECNETSKLLVSAPQNTVKTKVKDLKCESCGLKYAGKNEKQLLKD